MPIEELKAHNYLLDGLGRINSVDNIKLVSRAYNKKIGNASTDRLYIFFPDMHLIARQDRKEKNWMGFNHERMFMDILKKMIALKKASTDIKFHVLQLGDFVDLWRIGTDQPSPVLNDYATLAKYLFKGGRNKSVDAQFIVGNHDGLLAEDPVLSSRMHMSFYFPNDPAPAVYVTHGDTFDPVEVLPAELKAFFVYNFTGTRIEDIIGGGDKAKILGDLKTIREETCRDIGKDKTSNIGTLQTVSTAAALSETENVQNSHSFLKAAMERVRTFDGVTINASVNAHTHTAGIAIDEATGFTLMDVGGWVGQYDAGGGKAIPCCQIGVVCGNDFRVYQFDPNTAISKRFIDE